MEKIEERQRCFFEVKGDDEEKILCMYEKEAGPKRYYKNPKIKNIEDDIESEDLKKALKVIAAGIILSYKGNLFCKANEKIVVVWSEYDIK